MAGSADRYCVQVLKKERENCRFDKEEITNLVDDGAENSKIRRKIEEIVFSDPAFVDQIPPEYMSHKEMYENELRKSVYFLQKFSEDERLQELAGGLEGIRVVYQYGLGHAINKDGNPLMLHSGMFIPALLGQGDEDQVSHWLPQAFAGQIIGTYAQTELGHGTFLRGLETTATYVPATQEFVLHSPTVTASKWWPGGLGKTANHAVVMAQLYSKGVCHGPHPFIVQLRDEDTHQSLPGVTLGEIGPKLGFNTTDNGFLRFNNFRIPRRNLLMKHSQVMEDGTYVKPASKKLAYGTMVFVRVGICFDSIRHLMRAVTIATRYAAVRHQSEIVPGEGEAQILEYQTQQYKLLPQISTVFALMFSANSVRDTYYAVQENIKDGNLNLLPELHALSCGLKALSTTDVTSGIEILRLSCGGHGYLSSSNLPRIFVWATAAQTYEGENTVLWLQVARYLMKCFREASKGGQLQPSVSYLTEVKQKITSTNDLSNQGLIESLKRSVLKMLQSSAAELDSRQEAGERYERAWNASSIGLVNCAQVHTRYFVCKQFVESVSVYEGSEPVKRLLGQLCRLYLLYTITRNQGILLRAGSLKSVELSALEGEIGELLADLRLDAVNIVDAFDCNDAVLNSTLGSWDGDVYNRLYKAAMESPLNKSDVTDAYHKYMKSHLKSNL